MKDFCRIRSSAASGKITDMNRPLVITGIKEHLKTLTVLLVHEHLSFINATGEAMETLVRCEGNSSNAHLPSVAYQCQGEALTLVTSRRPLPNTDFYWLLSEISVECSPCGKNGLSL